MNKEQDVRGGPGLTGTEAQERQVETDRRETVERNPKSAVAQVDKLAKFILEHEAILGEPSRSEGAVDVSIRLHKVLLQAIATLSTLPGYTDMTPFEVMESQKKLAAEV
jgi:hypothetical protein